jgi:hypothetical protein
MTTVFVICGKCCLFLNTIFCGILLTGIIFALPITELVFAIYFRNQIVCHTPLFIGLDNWLIVKGAVTLCSTIFLALVAVSTKNSLCFVYSIWFIYLFSIFLLGWTIVGSIIFWRDCYNLTPIIVNNYMWFELIYSYVMICSSVNYKGN